MQARAPTAVQLARLDELDAAAEAEAHVLLRSAVPRVLLRNAQGTGHARYRHTPQTHCSVVRCPAPRAAPRRSTQWHSPSRPRRQPEWRHPLPLQHPCGRPPGRAVSDAVALCTARERTPSPSLRAEPLATSGRIETTRPAWFSSSSCALENVACRASTLAPPPSAARAAVDFPSHTHTHTHSRRVRCVRWRADSQMVRCAVAGSRRSHSTTAP
jgi:hypothetical protein